MSGIDPGRVDIRLEWGDGGAARVHVASRRPDIARALHGRPAQEAVALVAVLFAVCGKAQGTAARLALAAAQGASRAGAIDPAVAAEAAREHAWRLCLDWPRLFGRLVDRTAFTALIKSIGAGEPLAWTVPEWLPTLDDAGPEATLLPPMDAETSAACWPALDADFARQPTWQGRAAETGALARQQRPDGGGIRARVLARAVELQRHLAGQPTLMGRVSAVPLSPGVGRATVETARGLLMHEIVLDGERIERYTIVAPTEWNFHPEGTLARCLPATTPGAHADVRERLARWVLALDPCVPSSITGLPPQLD